MCMDEVEGRKLPPLLRDSCHSAAIVWIQFQNASGISQREGCDKEHRLLKLKKGVPHQLLGTCDVQLSHSLSFSITHQSPYCGRSLVQTPPKMTHSAHSLFLK